MRNPIDEGASSVEFTEDEEPQLAYASDVQIAVDSGGVQLTFTRPRPIAKDQAAEENVTQEGRTKPKVIARVVLPPLAARRLLKLLPGGLDSQRVLADEYEQETERAPEAGDAATNDPFLAALAAAEIDDEPYTDEQREATRAGNEAFARGEFDSLEDVWRDLTEEGGAVIRRHQAAQGSRR